MIPEKKISPVLYPLDRNLKTTWFIKWKVPDYLTGRYKYVKYSGMINRYDTVEERLHQAMEYINMIHQGKELPVCQGARYARADDAPRNFANTIQLAELHVVQLKKQMEHNSYQRFPYKIQMLKRWLEASNMGELPIGQFNKGKVSNFLSYLLLKGLSPQSVNRYRTDLSEVWDQILAANADIEILNPWKMVASIKKVTVKRYEHFTVAEEQILQRELPRWDPQLHMFTQFIYYLLMRPLEISRLRISDIDWNTGAIDLGAGIVKKSEGRINLIPYPLLEALIQQEYDLCDPDHFIFSRSGRPGPQSVGKNYFNRKFKAFREAVGLPENKKPYGLKGTADSKLIRSGMDPVLVRDHNGHESLDQTMHYVGKIDLSAKVPVRESYPAMGVEISQPDNTYQTFIKALRGVRESKKSNL